MTPECVFIHLCIHFKYICWILMNLRPFVLLRRQTHAWFYCCFQKLFSKMTSEEMPLWIIGSHSCLMGRRKVQERVIKILHSDTFWPRNSCSNSLLIPVGSSRAAKHAIHVEGPQAGILAQIRNQMVPACQWSEMRKAWVNSRQLESNLLL